MKLGVIAGTLYDTEMGNAFFKSKGFDTVSVSMCKTCTEQSNMQYFNKKELEEIFLNKALMLKENGADVIIIYCNSLSAAIDYRNLEKKVGLEIITPLEVYSNISGYKSVFILAANALSAFNIERIIKEKSKDINTVSCGFLPLVELIEEGLEDSVIAENLSLDSLIDFIQGMKGDFAPEALLLGCTHFPHMREYLEKKMNIEIIDPSNAIVDILKNMN